MNNIEKLLQDQRMCKSENMKKFFRNKGNRVYDKVIRFDGKLWFVLLGWDADGKSFAGVRVQEVACFGAKAKTSYPSWQRKYKWEDVTEWFWDKYWERGIVSIPEIWNRYEKRPITSKEAHCI